MVYNKSLTWPTLVIEWTVVDLQIPFEILQGAVLGTLTAEHSISWKIVPRGVQHQSGVAANYRLFLAIVASMVGINISWRATAEFCEDVTALMHRQGAIAPITLSDSCSTR